MLAAGFAVAAWVGWLADADERAAEEHDRHEYQVAQLRPERPLAVLHAIVKASHEDDPMLGLLPVHTRRPATVHTGRRVSITGRGYATSPPPT